jgi:hypothetical protein
MPSGKRNHHCDDTLLYFGELLMSRMRACLDRKERQEFHPLASRGIAGQLDGAASDENRFLLVPREVWERVQPAINALARTAGVAITHPEVYWSGEHTTIVRFHAEHPPTETHRERVRA